MSDSREPAVRDLLALALDLDSLEAARELGRRLIPFFSVAKVGLELYAAAGPRAIEVLRGDGFEVFVDLKLHDIPATVERAARVLARLGARYVTLHVEGGEAMLRAGVEGLGLGAEESGRSDPVAVGVTVLTSEPVASEAVLAGRAALAASSGCGGLVCAAGDLPVVERVAPGLCKVVPGIRFAGSPRDDQARVATPAEALSAGAGLLVVGRAVTAAADPVGAAVEMVESLSPRGWAR